MELRLGHAVPANTLCRTGYINTELNPAELLSKPVKNGESR